MDDFNLSDFCDEKDELATAHKQPKKRLPRHRPGESFLKGPIPGAWLHLAMQLPGKALHVALLLWMAAGILGRRTVPFKLTAAARHGIHWNTARRAVRSLE